ncbi:hypothetical protein EMIT0P218_60119 [Pseudomonas sp. IT-P218]
MLCYTPAFPPGSRPDARNRSRHLDPATAQLFSPRERSRRAFVTEAGPDGIAFPINAIRARQDSHWAKP